MLAINYQYVSVISAIAFTVEKMFWSQHSHTFIHIKVLVKVLTWRKRPMSVLAQFHKVSHPIISLNTFNILRTVWDLQMWKHLVCKLLIAKLLTADHYLSVCKYYNCNNFYDRNTGKHATKSCCNHSILHHVIFLG